MKFLEIFSKNIFRLFAGRFLSRLSENSLEATLARSLRILDSQTIDEIKNYIKGLQTKEGGFADKAGNSDLYYTLFGCLVAEAFEIEEVKPALKAYLKNIIATEELSGIYLKCAVIIYAKLFGGTTPRLIISTDKRLATQYADFINVLSYYYSKDYISLLLISQKLKKVKLRAEMPCSVMAASLILQDGYRIQHDEPWQWMSGYYRNGGFSAFSKIADGDLLSTGVALYSLRFVDSDLSIIKPDCLTYIDSLYSEGGFCASRYDADPDIEYTFYGLLGLGSLTY